jgi:predicted RNase H-like HicB family nuclease
VCQSDNNAFIFAALLHPIMKCNCLIEKDEDGYYYASVPSLPGCFTQAKSYDELIKRLDEAITLYLETNEAPEPDELREFVGAQTI